MHGKDRKEDKSIYVLQLPQVTSDSHQQDGVPPGLGENLSSLQLGLTAFPREETSVLHWKVLFPVGSRVSGSIGHSSPCPRFFLLTHLHGSTNAIHASLHTQMKTGQVPSNSPLQGHQTNQHHKMKLVNQWFSTPNTVTLS